MATTTFLDREQAGSRCDGFVRGHRTDAADGHERDEADLEYEAHRSP